MVWMDTDYLLNKSCRYDDPRSKVFREPERWTGGTRTTVSTPIVKLSSSTNVLKERCWTPSPSLEQDRRKCTDERSDEDDEDGSYP
jgi:hypothetical protein